jgi:hypothetical protein
MHAIDDEVKGHALISASAIWRAMMNEPAMKVTTTMSFFACPGWISEGNSMCGAYGNFIDGESIVKSCLIRN